MKLKKKLKKEEKCLFFCSVCATSNKNKTKNLLKTLPLLLFTVFSIFCSQQKKKHQRSNDKCEAKRTKTKKKKRKFFK